MMIMVMDMRARGLQIYQKGKSIGCGERNKMEQFYEDNTYCLHVSILYDCELCYTWYVISRDIEMNQTSDYYIVASFLHFWVLVKWDVS